MTRAASIDTGPRDAFVVGSGPNGLMAAIYLARAGRLVAVLEANSTIGGGCRTADLTLPGFRHDVCSAFHPMARSSPAFNSVPLDRLGVTYVEAPVQLGHPLDDGSVGLVYRDVGLTAQRFGEDGRRYVDLMAPIAREWPFLVDNFLGPFNVPLSPLRIARKARFGSKFIRSLTSIAGRFETPLPRALLAGCAAHSMLRLTEPASAAYGLTLLGSAHAVGWPMIATGSQALADALTAYLHELGGEVLTDCRVEDLAALPPHRAELLDLVPRGVLQIAGGRFDGSWRRRNYKRELENYRYGPGVFKLDLALSEPIPWRNRELLEAGTVHLGGTIEEIARGEATVRSGQAAERPFVLVGQQSLFDRTRIPAGAPPEAQTVWAYCHVPNGSTVDMTESILSQIERFAPGFRDTIIGSNAMGPRAIEAHNANYVGGDINGGLEDLRQLFTRPAIRLDPYATPDPSMFICSSATPPGGGVHGLCGAFAAHSALHGVLR